MQSRMEDEFANQLSLDTVPLHSSNWTLRRMRTREQRELQQSQCVDWHNWNSTDYFVNRIVAYPKKMAMELERSRGSREEGRTYRRP